MQLSPFKPKPVDLSSIDFGNVTKVDKSKGPLTPTPLNPNPPKTNNVPQITELNVKKPNSRGFSIDKQAIRENWKQFTPVKQGGVTQHLNRLTPDNVVFTDEDTAKISAFLKKKYPDSDKKFRLSKAQEGVDTYLSYKGKVGDGVGAFPISDKRKQENIENEENIKKARKLNSMAPGLGNKAYGVDEDQGSILGGAIAQVPETIGDTLESGRKFVIGIYDKLGLVPDKHKERIEKEAKQVQDMFANIKSSAQDLMGVDPNATATKVGEFATDFGATIATPTPIGKALVIGKLGKTGSKIAQGAIEGAIDVAKFDAVSKGEIASVGEIAGGALVGGSIPGIGVIGSKVGGKIKEGAKGLANKLQLSGLLNPKKLEYVSNALKETGDEVDNVANWMFDRNIKGTKQEIVERLSGEAKKTRTAVKEGVASVKGKFKNESVGNSLDELIDAMGTPKSSDQINKLEGFKKLRQKHIDDGLELKDIQQVKEDIDEVFSLFTVAGDVKSGQKKVDLAGLRRDVRGFIESKGDEVGIDFKDLNKNTAVAKQLEKYVNYKDKTDAVRDLLSPFASPMAGGVLGGLYGGETLEQRVTNIIGGAIFGKVATSTLVKTKASEVLNKLSKSEISALTNLLDGVSSKLLPISLYEKLGEILPDNILGSSEVEDSIEEKPNDNGDSK